MFDAGETLYAHPPHDEVGLTVAVSQAIGTSSDAIMVLRAVTVYSTGLEATVAFYHRYASLGVFGSEFEVASCAAADGPWWGIQLGDGSTVTTAERDSANLGQSGSSPFAGSSALIPTMGRIERNRRDEVWWLRAIRPQDIRRWLAGWAAAGIPRTSTEISLRVDSREETRRRLWPTVVDIEIQPDRIEKMFGSDLSLGDAEQ